MEEKVLYLNLPVAKKFLKVKVTGKAQKHTKNRTKEKVKVEIPKPKALVGGGEVYQNDDVPYWYCKIKNGRDTFMHLYMEDLTEKDLLYDSKTGRKRIFSTRYERRLKEIILEALANKPKEGFRWIPVYEPSLASDGSVQFVEGEKPLVKISVPRWNQMLEEYSPENESGESSDTTYFLLLLRWLKDGIATLEELSNHSEKIGHYWDSENAKPDFEKTGERKFGGLYGFVGNTCKMVKSEDFGILILGANYENSSFLYPVCKIRTYGNLSGNTQLQTLSQSEIETISKQLSLGAYLTDYQIEKLQAIEVLKYTVGLIELKK